MYIVRFLRKDEQPNEEYYYNSMHAALEHFMLFENDDSNLFEEICLIMEK